MNPTATRKAAADLTSRDAIWTNSGLRYVIHVDVQDRVVVISTSTGRIYANPTTVFDVEYF